MFSRAKEHHGASAFSNIDVTLEPNSGVGYFSPNFEGTGRSYEPNVNRNRYARRAGSTER